MKTKQFEKPTKCPSCDGDITQPGYDERMHGYKCPSCGHRIYCFFCGYPQIRIKDDKWACPFIEGSGMHFGLYSPTDDEENERWLRENRFGKAGFTLEEYRLAVNAFAVYTNG